MARGTGRWTKGAGLAAALAVLVAGAASFALLAPADYGVPKPEILDAGPSGERIAHDGIFANYFPAEGAGPHPAILLLGGSEGGLGPGTLHMARDLQGHGYTVLQLAYFGAPGLPDALERIPLETFDRGLDWLAAQPGVDPARLAVIGASKGAEAALLVGTRRADVRAVVAGMPSSVVWPGIDWRAGGRSALTSWTADGRDLAPMPYAGWNPSQGVISVYRSVEDPALAEAAERAAIPVEQAQAPVLLVCGEAETLWPACPMARAVRARAAARGGPPVTVLAYADAGHLVFGPPVPPEAPFYPRLAMMGGSVEGNAAARADSWPQVLRFLEAALGRPPALNGASGRARPE